MAGCDEARAVARAVADCRSGGERNMCDRKMPAEETVSTNAYDAARKPGQTKHRAGLNAL